MKTNSTVASTVSSTLHAPNRREVGKTSWFGTSMWLLLAVALIGLILFVRSRINAVKRSNMLLQHERRRTQKMRTKIERPPQAKASATPRQSEEIVTVMFIDAASFSLIAEQKSPRDVFASLKSLLTTLTDTIAAHGGIVDRTLGDGILCFFRNGLVDGENIGNHVDKAIHCAMAIQQASLERTLSAKDTNDAVFPLRIGINTASVYIGDLGEDGRMDFTLIGNGVNYAKRLEDGCDHYCMMLSKTTLELSSRFSLTTPGMRKRLVPIKHQQELAEAIECDPLHATPKLREEAIELHRTKLNLSRKNERHPSKKIRRIQIPTNFGTAALVDFSLTGLGIALPIYLARGAGVRIELGEQCTSSFQSLHKRYGLDSILTEVRWGRPGDVKGEYIHGIAIKNLSDAQLDMLFGHLQKAMTTRPESIRIPA